MKTNTIRVWAGAALLSISAVAMADDHGAKTMPAEVPMSVQAASGWTNQSGSTLYIDAIAPSGQITGHYINRAPGFGCQNLSYPVTGWIYGTAITFTVTWRNPGESCNSITAWTGFFANGQITTLWQLVRNGSTGPGQIMKGSDVFRPTPHIMRESLLLEQP